MSPSAAPASPVPTAPTETQSVVDSKPAASKTELPSNITVTSHPVLSHKITILRSSKTSPGTFRSVLREVTYHLGYEATKNLKVQSEVRVTVPLGKESESQHEDLRDADCGFRLLDKVALVPILRSGLGMTDSMLELLPNSSVHHIGMYRTPGVHVTPVQYFNRLPRGKCSADVAYILDPMVGSAATANAVISILKKWGVPKIHIVTVVASRAGLELLAKTHPDVDVTVGIVDPKLTECGIVLPGMGDVGDRLFGTGNQYFEDDVVVSGATDGTGEEPPTKRKRSASLTLEMDLAGNK
eukprot:jgi/Psemu1/207085/e_gw1.426.45.1